jgi:hypothetical protein
VVGHGDLPGFSRRYSPMVGVFHLSMISSENRIPLFRIMF